MPRCTETADAAFVSGIHLAVCVGAILALVSAAIVARYLPHSLAPEGAMHGPVEALEEAAELGLGGVPPVFSDQVESLNGGNGHAPPARRPSDQTERA